MWKNVRLPAKALYLGLGIALVAAASGCGSRAKEGSVVELSAQDQAASDESDNFMKEQQRKRGRR